MSRTAGQIFPVCQFFRTFSYSALDLLLQSSRSPGCSLAMVCPCCKPDLFSPENCNRERHRCMLRIWSAVVTAVIGLLGYHVFLPTRLCFISCCRGRNNMDAYKCVDYSSWHHRTDAQMAVNSSTNMGSCGAKSANTYSIK